MMLCDRYVCLNSKASHQCKYIEPMYQIDLNFWYIIHSCTLTLFGSDPKRHVFHNKIKINRTTKKWRSVEKGIDRLKYGFKSSIYLSLFVFDSSQFLAVELNMWAHSSYFQRLSTRHVNYWTVFISRDIDLDFIRSWFHTWMSCRVVSSAFYCWRGDDSIYHACQSGASYEYDWR